MDRRNFMKRVGAGASLLAMAAAPPLPQKRNVILYVADDLGMDDAGCYGNKVVRTPGMDALAGDGVRFIQAYCTVSSCSPSRSVLLTGKHNHTTGQYGLAHSHHHFVSLPDVKSLPLLLHDAGYRTVCAGKFHLEPEPLYHFDQYIRSAAPARMAAACESLMAAADDAPFFLYFCPTEPHRPFQRDGAAAIDPKDVSVPSYLPDIPECRAELAEYYSSIERCDSGLPPLMQLLKKTGHWEDTLIIFVSDNGAPWPGAKTTLYDPGTRLPCIIRNPFEKNHGLVCDAMITWADITPTILDFTGALTQPDAFHGRSVLPVLSQEHPKGWDEIYGSHTFHEVTMYYPMRSIRTRRHKLIMNIAHPLEYPFAADLWESRTWQAVLARNIRQYGKRSVDAYVHRPRFELYDLEADPDEIHNRADDPSQRQVFEQLRERLFAFQDRTKDPWVIKRKHE